MIYYYLFYRIQESLIIEIIPEIWNQTNVTNKQINYITRKEYWFIKFLRQDKLATKNVFKWKFQINWFKMRKIYKMFQKSINKTLIGDSWSCFDLFVRTR